MSQFVCQCGAPLEPADTVCQSCGRNPAERGEADERPWDGLETVAHFQIANAVRVRGARALFTARDTLLERDVALLVHRLEASDDEPPAIAAAGHSNIAAVFETGRAGATGYAAAEWPGGPTLAESVPENGIPWRQAADYGLQIADALAHLHALGLAHGPLSADDVWIDEDGRAIIIGVDAPTADDESFRADIRALGRLLRFALGSPAVKAKQAPRALRALIDRCDAGEPPESAAQVASALRALIEANDRPPASAKARAVWLLAAALAATALWLGWRQSAWRTRPAVLEPDLILAALPLANPADDPMIQVFCDGLSAALNHRLTDLDQSGPGWWVVPVEEIRRMEQRSLADVHRKFGADRVIAGEVILEDGSFHIELALLDPESGEALANERIVAPQDALFSLRTQAAEKALAMLGLNPADQPESAPTAISTAYERYLYGLGYLYRYGEGDNIARAVEAFEAAIVLDPQFTAAYVQLSESCVLQWWSLKEPRWLERAQKNAERAAALDPRHISAWIALGAVHNERGRYDEAIAIFRRALNIQPHNARALIGLAAAWHGSGQPEEAEAAHRQAVAHHPNNVAVFLHLGFFYFRNGQFEQAAEAFRQGAAAAPQNYIAQRNLGGALYALARYDEALAALRAALALKPSASVHSNIGSVLFVQGKYAEAVEAFEAAVKLSPNRYLLWGNLADAYRWSPERRDLAPDAYRRAIALLQEVVALREKDPGLNMDLAVYWAKLGDADRARQAVAEVDLGSDPYLHLERSLVAELTGDRDAALDYLREALTRNLAPAEVAADPEFAALRADPRYRDLLTDAL